MFKSKTHDQFSNESLQKFLEGLQYIHADHTENETALEFIHLRSIESVSLVWAKIIASLDRFTLGNFGYRVNGNRLTRTGKSIKYSGNSDNPLVRLSSPFKIKIKKRQKEFVVSVD